MTQKKLKAEIENLPLVEGDWVDEVDEAMFHALAPLTLFCSNKECGKQNRVEAEGGEIIIAPFREPTEPYKSRIRFGK